MNLLKIVTDMVIEKYPDGKMLLYIFTLEDDHKAIGGDYIIKGVHEEFYSCKPDIFEETYVEWSQYINNDD